MDIVCLGELLIDMFPAELGRGLTEVSAFNPKPGGAPANAAVAARRLGAEAAFIGKVGDDAFGHYLIAVLQGEGVDTRGMRVDPDARTTMAFIAMPDANTAEFVFYRNPGADTRLRADELDADLLRSTRAFHFGSLSLTDEPSRSATYEALQIAGEAGALLSYDVNYRPSLWRSPEEALAQVTAMLPRVHLLKVNETELMLINARKFMEPSSQDTLEAFSQALLDQGPEVVVVTLGPLGSYFRTRAGGGSVPPFKVEAVDAVGCGDSFIAALLTQLVVAHDDWREVLTVDQMYRALRYANAAGALTATKQGVIPALPTAAQVDEFLNAR
jgi:fructokinase